MSTQKYIIGLLVGAALLGCGVYLHWQQREFLANSAEASARITRLQDNNFLAFAADVNPASLLLHSCKYAVEFMAERKQEISTHIDQISKTCLSEGQTIGILYERAAPRNAMLFTVDNNAGKMWIAFGVLILGLTYFVWVGENKREK